MRVFKILSLNFNTGLDGYVTHAQISHLRISRTIDKQTLAICKQTRATAKPQLFINKPRALNSVNLDYFFTLITYGTDLITPFENSVLVSAYTALSSAFETSASLTCTFLS